MSSFLFALENQSSTRNPNNHRNHSRCDAARERGGPPNKYVQLFSDSTLNLDTTIAKRGTGNDRGGQTCGTGGELFEDWSLHVSCEQHEDTRTCAKSIRDMMSFCCAVSRFKKLRATLGVETRYGTAEAAQLLRVFSFRANRDDDAKYR